MTRLKNMPKFIDKKIDMIKASKMLHRALQKNASRIFGDDSYADSETFIRLTDDKKGIHVGFESCPHHDWGVDYSLGGYPKSYSMHENPQDWYLEVYWGFDVMFYPNSSSEFPTLDESILD